MNLPLLALILPWKMMLDATYQRKLQDPPPLYLHFLSLTRVFLPCPVCWQAAHSMTTCFMCGAGTGFQMRLSRDQNNDDQMWTLADYSKTPLSNYLVLNKAECIASLKHGHDILFQSLILWNNLSQYMQLAKSSIFIMTDFYKPVFIFSFIL